MGSQAPFTQSPFQNVVHPPLTHCFRCSPSSAWKQHPLPTIGTCMLASCVDTYADACPPADASGRVASLLSYRAFCRARVPLRLPLLLRRLRVHGGRRLLLRVAAVPLAAVHEVLPRVTGGGRGGGGKRPRWHSVATNPRGSAPSNAVAEGAAGGCQAAQRYMRRVRARPFPPWPLPRAHAPPPPPLPLSHFHTCGRPWADHLSPPPSPVVVLVELVHVGEHAEDGACHLALPQVLETTRHSRARGVPLQ
jgi:hypothetical protein